MPSNSIICQTCFARDRCDIICAALNELTALAIVQDKADKSARLRSMSKQLIDQKAKPNKELRILGDKIIRHFPEFAFIREFNIKIGYVISDESKSGEKTVFADCRKVGEVFRAWLPYDFIITFYERNTGFLDENQKKLLMVHELKHIGIGERGLKIIPHDIEDFQDILEKYGLDWNRYGKELPDILAGE